MARRALDGGSGVFTAGYLPGAKLVKAFNTLPWKILANEGGTGLAMAIAGDDEVAVQTERPILAAVGSDGLSDTTPSGT
jgi:predicted dinucleotide-binding enzyme